MNNVMNSLPRQKLCEIIAKYGYSLCEDPRRCEGLLRDLCGEHKREIFVLICALKERVADDLLASQDGIPREVLLSRLMKRLQDNLALSEDAARWAVETWALALGRTSRSITPLRSAPGYGVIDGALGLAIFGAMVGVIGGALSGAINGVMGGMSYGSGWVTLLLTPLIVLWAILLAINEAIMGAIRLMIVGAICGGLAGAVYEVMDNLKRNQSKGGSP